MSDASKIETNGVNPVPDDNNKKITQIQIH